MDHESVTRSVARPVVGSVVRSVVGSVVRRPVLGAATVVAAATLAISTAAVVGDPLAPPASAAEGLTAFTGCATLRQWYVDNATARLASPGRGGPVTVGRADAAGAATSAERSPVAAPTTPDESVGSSGTGTNVQEKGVDEPDVAKTDGRLLLRVAHDALVVEDVTGAQPRTLGSFTLPEGMTDVQVLLAGHRAVLVGGQQRGAVMHPMTSPGDGLVAPDGATDLARPTLEATRVITLDLTDPTRPGPVSDRTLSGRLLSARQYGGTVRVVTASTPSFDVIEPDLAGADGLEARDRAVLQSTSADDWLPTVTDNTRPGSPTRRLLGCRDVLHPVRPSGPGTVTVVGFDVAHPADLATTAVTADGDTVYSSTDALYVATTRWSRGVPGRVVGGASHPTTQLHELTFDGDHTTYAASGTVTGTIQGRWSLDEHDGHLRVAVETGNPVAVRDGEDRDGANAVVVLHRVGDRLVETGRVGGLGDGEQIKSVRWFDDLAVVVTFRQMDPLYTVDLSDPEHPTLTGALHVPGFSGYLHPIGGGRLLGLGVEATSKGTSEGALVQVFDLADLTSPRRLSRQVLPGTGTYLPAVDDPRAFTWLGGDGAGTGITPLASWDGDGRLRLARVRVDQAGTVSVTTEPLMGVDGYEVVRTLPLPDGRVVVVTAGAARTLTAG